MKYAVVELNGHQYLVKPGDKITVDGTLGEAGDTIKGGTVLLLNDGQIKIGTPVLDVPLTLKVADLTKSTKIDVSTYKSKSRYRKSIGHRQKQTVIEVVSVAGLKPEVKPVKKEASKKEIPPKKEVKTVKTKTPKAAPKASKPKTGSK